MGQIARLASEQRDDVGDGALQPAGRHGYARRGKASENPIAGRLFVALRQLHAGDAALAPDDAAVADRRFEQCKTKIFHNKIFRNKLADDGINIGCVPSRPPVLYSRAPPKRTSSLRRVLAGLLGHMRPPHGYTTGLRAVKMPSPSARTPRSVLWRLSGG